MSLIGKTLQLVKNLLLDIRATYYLKRVSAEKHDMGKPIKVGFIVFEPQTWDKLEPIYNEMLERSDFEACLIVIPNFDKNLVLDKNYGPELEFFNERTKNVVLAYDSRGDVINLEKLGLDYVFYQDPYNEHYPKGLRSTDVVKYSRICYVPYGYTISGNFSNLLLRNKAFFRNVSLFFSDSNSVTDVMKTVFDRNYKNGIQRILELGYPAFETYIKSRELDVNNTITWAPRWTYDKSVGGSHFCEYKDNFIELRKRYNSSNLIFRPHPMLFSNMVKIGKMTEKEVNAYIGKLKKNRIDILDECSIDQVLSKTHILISDISSVIPSFFMTGKPVIYCKSELSTNAEFDEMLKGIYVADNWDEVLGYIESILRDTDYMKEKRMEILNLTRFKVHNNSSKSIADYLSNNLLSKSDTQKG